LDVQVRRDGAELGRGDRAGESPRLGAQQVPTLEELIANPDRVDELDDAQKSRLLWLALRRFVVLEGRILKLRLMLLWLYGLRSLGFK
jgi:hypothetical protein